MAHPSTTTKNKHRLAKGNQFKNKTVLMEKIHSMKGERAKSKQLDDQKEARLSRARAKNARREQRKGGKE